MLLGKRKRAAGCTHHLIAAIEHTGWTQKEMAAVLGVCDRTLRRWFDGESPMPRGIALVCHSLVSGKPVADLMEDDISPCAGRAVQ